MDLENPTLVTRLLELGANVNCLNYGGFAPYHLTYGRQNEEIRSQLYERTAQELRELPDSESDESDMDDLDLLEEEVSTGFIEISLQSHPQNKNERVLKVLFSSHQQLYDDIKFGK